MSVLDGYCFLGVPSLIGVQESEVVIDRLTPYFGMETLGLGDENAGRLLQ